MASLQGYLRSQAMLRTDPSYHGGQVVITGDGINGQVRLGAGVVNFLASIPDDGLDPGTLTDEHGPKPGWLREELSEAGLVRADGDIYRRTDLADSADYEFEPSPPEGELTLIS